MYRSVLLGLLCICFLSIPAYATNGDNLIGVGPISRAMGGVGIAAPQDAISAVFANPAAMCFGPYCPSSEVNFGGTLFMPDVSAKISGPNVGGTNKADSDEEVYAIPAIGISIPITDGFDPPNWRFGLAAYGVTGLGVDYRETDIDRTNAGFGGFPLVAGDYTQLNIMRFAPAIAFQPNSKLSFGLAGIVEYGNLDLESGSSWEYGFGIQLGSILKVNNHFSVGLSYTSPRKVDYKMVNDFDGDGSLDDLTLESPQELGLGLAFSYGNFLIETDAKWINWGGADGYEDFDWEDQYVFAIGAQYEPVQNLFLRVGYNYADHPLKDNDGFDGTLTATVQGKSLPNYYFETFRMVGFPAIVKHHLTLGIGYEFSETVSVHVGYVHAFEETFKESGTDLAGQPVTIESSLSEDTIDFGLTIRF